MTESTPGPALFNMSQNLKKSASQKTSLDLARREFHTKTTSPDNVGPGSYNFLPIISKEGHKYSMSFSNYNLHVSPNDFVPGPKYLASNSHFNKPLLGK
jgi:hypothetical protein